MNLAPNPTLVAASNALEDIRETSLRLRALLDMMTGNGYAIFEELDDGLRESLIAQAFFLAVEINDKSGAAIAAVNGGQA
ncbi:hypothetical protein [Achromobacter xylosoxidans]|uniref:hypothetical protein n=1 Tax=Alcaligenes xylosoxydans xylosoxydans TaxID=85698 RepID=UPI00047A4239|nr:hypothetical protein [Achromobacter xylosoxidans]